MQALFDAGSDKLMARRLRALAKKGWLDLAQADWVNPAGFERLFGAQMAESAAFVMDRLGLAPRADLKCLAYNKDPARALELFGDAFSDPARAFGQTMSFMSGCFEALGEAAAPLEEIQKAVDAAEERLNALGRKLEGNPGGAGPHMALANLPGSVLCAMGRRCLDWFEVGGQPGCAGDGRAFVYLLNKALQYKIRLQGGPSWEKKADASRQVMNALMAKGEFCAIGELCRGLAEHEMKALQDAAREVMLYTFGAGPTSQAQEFVDSALSSAQALESYLERQALGEAAGLGKRLSRKPGL